MQSRMLVLRLDLDANALKFLMQLKSDTNHINITANDNKLILSLKIQMVVMGICN